MRPSKMLFAAGKWAQHMWNVTARLHSAVPVIGCLALVAALSAPALIAGGATAQNKKNDNKEADSASLIPAGSLPDPQAIDLVVGQMLGAWQVGQVEMMHKFYAEDVVVVSGAWEQPLIGWQSYAQAYQQQFARTNGGRLDRTNTYSKVLGDTAWVTYQWQYSGQMDGTPISAVGHTTLLLQKRAGNWVIVLNHTSQVPTAPAAPATSPHPASTPQPSSEQK